MATGDSTAQVGALVDFSPFGAESQNAQTGALVDFSPFGTESQNAQVGVLLDFQPIPGGVAQSVQVGLLVDFHPPVPNRERFGVQGTATRRASSVQGNRFKGRAGRGRRITKGSEFD
jgi:hypothetical protein